MMQKGRENLFAEYLLKAAEAEAQSQLDKLTWEETKDLHVREELERSHKNRDNRLQMVIPVYKLGQMINGIWHMYQQFSQMTL